MYRQTALPRWMGVNLQGMFCTPQSTYTARFPEARFPEEDFQMTAELGFRFVRLPLSWLLLCRDRNPDNLNEEGLQHLDEAVEWGAKYGLHTNICLHRAPGYCINTDETPDPWQLLKGDPQAEAAFRSLWRSLTLRYRDISPQRLSFDLVNEPQQGVRKIYAPIMRRTVEDIHAISPQRLVVIDGAETGREPLPELADLPNTAQSCRGYDPIELTHYQSHPVLEGLPPPSWPSPAYHNNIYNGDVPLWDRQRLDDTYDAWAKMAQETGVGVHCGEGGVGCKTEHKLALRFLDDLLDSLYQRNIGFALWQLRGRFGILDSGRTDTAYADWRGHKLDSEMLTLFRKYL